MKTKDIVKVIIATIAVLLASVVAPATLSTYIDQSAIQNNITYYATQSTLLAPLEDPRIVKTTCVLPSPHVVTDEAPDELRLLMLIRRVIDRSTVCASTAAVDDTIKYTITVTNPNDRTLENFIVLDELSAHVSFVPNSLQVRRNGVAAPNVRMTEPEENRVVEIVFSELSANGVYQIIFEVTVGEKDTSEARLYHYIPGSVDPNTGQRQPGMPGDYIGSTVTEQESDRLPTIAKDIDLSPVNVGDSIDYTIRVTNQIADEALVGDVTVLDNLDMAYVELSRESLTVTRGEETLEEGEDYAVGFDPTTGALTITFDGLPASSITVISFRVTVIERPTSGFVKNSASLEFTLEDNNFSLDIPSYVEVSEVRVPVFPLGDYDLPPTITKDADLLSVNIGETIAYTIRVTNQMEDEALVGDVVVTDNLDIAYVELNRESITVTREEEILAEREDFTVEFDPTTGLLAITFDGLPAGSVTEISFRVTVIERPASGVVNNSASLDFTLEGNNFPLDTPPYEETLPVVMQVFRAEDQYPVLAITNSSNPASGTVVEPMLVEVGQEINYSIIVKNTSEVTARDIIAVDVIPYFLDLTVPIRGYFNNDDAVEYQYLDGVAVSVANSAVLEDSVSHQSVHWLIENLEPGETFTLVIPTVVNDYTPAGTVFRNIARVIRVNREEVSLESPPTYHEVDKELTMLEGSVISRTDDDLLARATITKEADLRSVNVGETIAYTIRVTNPNNVDLVGNYVVTDNLAFNYVELDLASVNLRRGSNQLETDVEYTLSFDETTGALVINLLRLPASSITEITFTVEVIVRPANGYVRNVAMLEMPENDLPLFSYGTQPTMTTIPIDISVLESNPLNSSRRSPSSTQPSLPQTGALAGLTALGGSSLAGSGLAIASKKTKRSKISRAEYLDRKYEQEYNEIFYKYDIEYDEVFGNKSL